ncbi:GGDEF domain-containing protein [Halobacillus litoralis]|uniref:GGDEF domain-containing protein n=1 Tax=Halobacillus litoralis TaxID=45668 RepID=UPI001CD463D9|nr:GGDEF domain-containing protein [Halobacillus litoralis]MCA0972172.1 GGDEF domain-containing protein [Halobacillus litoralis]
MDYIVQFQLNIYAFIVLMVLFIIIKARARVESFGKKLLRMIMYATAVAIVIEPITWILDNKVFPGAYFLGYSTNFILFLMGPILGGLMLSYVDYHLLKQPARIYRRGFYQHVSVVTFFILLINIAYPLYFQILPEENRYISGDFKVAHYAVIAAPYLYMLIFSFRNRQRVPAYVSYVFMIFYALPIIGLALRLFEPELFFAWTTIVIGILVSYTFLESSSTELDSLTKLYHRQSYETYLRNLIETKRSFEVVVLDLNRFKAINDQYGHQKGDHVLIEFGWILQKTFHHNALTARLGGDEFVIVIEKDEDATVKRDMEVVAALLKKHPDPLLSSLTFSYGCQCYEPGMSMDELYNAADKKMYKVKRESRPV